MKKMAMFLVVGIVAFAFAVSANAGEMAGKSSAAKVVGEMVKQDGDFVEIKTGEGKMQKFHMDKTTTITGELKPGAMLEIEGHDGHAMSVVVHAAEKMTGSDKE